MIHQRLNNIQKINSTLVPIILDDTFNVFTPLGTMTAVAPLADSSTSWLWEQIQGTPVTYTSSLTGPTITWTSTDLERKRFKVYTNKGTTNEYSTTAWFLHYPLDVTDTPLVHTSSTFKTYSWLTTDNFDPIIRNGLIPIKSLSSFNTSNAPAITSNASLGSGNVTSKSVYQLTTELLTDDLKNQIVTTALQKLIGGVYTTVNTQIGLYNTYEGLEVGVYRVLLNCFYKGYDSILQLDFVRETNNVAESLNSNNVNVSSNILNYSAGVSTIKSILKNEQYTTISATSSNILKINQQVSTVIKIYKVEAMTNILAGTSSALSGYTYQLQTSTGII